MAKRFTIHVNSDIAYVEQTLPLRVLRAINKVTSFEQPGAWMHTGGPQRTYLFAKKTQRFPSGLLKRVKKAIKECDFKTKTIDHREEIVINDKKVLATIDGLKYQPRDYQVESLIDGVRYPYGLFWHVTASGKAVLISMLLNTYNVRSMILIHRKELLYQLAETITNVTGQEVGLIGDGHWNPKKWTVAIVNSLFRDNKLSNEAVRFLNRIEYLQVDECFVAGTRVKMGGYKKYKKIQDVEVGDIVSSFDTETKRFVEKKVLRVFEKAPTELLKLNLCNGAQIICTPNHEFWTEKREWVRVDELTSFDYLLTSDNIWVQINHIKPVNNMNAFKSVYNFEVEDTHTYIVANTVTSNCHHMGAKIWINIIKNCKKTKARHGFSGTCFRTDNADLLLLAHTGDVISRYTASYMIENGWISRPHIYSNKIDVGSYIGNGSWPDVERELIVENRVRNILGCQFTYDSAHQGEQVLLLVNKIKHGSTLKRMLIEEFGIEHRDIRYMTGSENSEVRKRALKDFKYGIFPIMIGTSIYDEGVDVPNIGAAANMAAGNSAIKTTQRLGRVLRKTVPEGASDVDPFVEQTVKYLDPIDRSHKYVRKHSLNRQKEYKKEEAFVLKGDYKSEQTS